MISTLSACVFVSQIVKETKPVKHLERSLAHNSSITEILPLSAATITTTVSSYCSPELKERVCVNVSVRVHVCM